VTAAATATGWGLLTDESDVTIEMSSVLYRNDAGRSPWKGYISKPELRDPWDQPFYVAIEDVEFVAGDPNQSTAIFVLSAGEDHIIQTVRKQNMQLFTIPEGSDDIVVRLR
jgi:hypothetical protein